MDMRGDSSVEGTHREAIPGRFSLMVVPTLGKLAFNIRS
jgi:hypothetical protein